MLSVVFSLPCIHYNKLLPAIPHPKRKSSNLLLFPLCATSNIHLSTTMTEEITLCIITPVCICQLHIQMEHMLQFLFCSLVAGICIRNFFSFKTISRSGACSFRKSFLLSSDIPVENSLSHMCLQLRTSEHRSMYSYVRLSIIDVQLRTSEHRSMYSYVRLSIDRVQLRTSEHRSIVHYDV